MPLVVPLLLTGFARLGRLQVRQLLLDLSQPPLVAQQLVMLQQRHRTAGQQLVMP